MDGLCVCLDFAKRNVCLCECVGRSIGRPLLVVACVVAVAAVDVCFITFAVSWYRESCFRSVVVSSPTFCYTVNFSLHLLPPPLIRISRCVLMVVVAWFADSLLIFFPRSQLVIHKTFTIFLLYVLCTIWHTVYIQTR